MTGEVVKKLFLSVSALLFLSFQEGCSQDSNLKPAEPLPDRIGSVSPTVDFFADTTGGQRKLDFRLQEVKDEHPTGWIKGLVAATVFDPSTKRFFSRFYLDVATGSVESANKSLVNMALFSTAEQIVAFQPSGFQMFIFVGTSSAKDIRQASLESAKEARERIKEKKLSVDPDAIEVNLTKKVPREFFFRTPLNSNVATPRIQSVRLEGSRWLVTVLSANGSKKDLVFSPKFDLEEVK